MIAPLFALFAIAALAPAKGPEGKLDRAVLDGINDCGPAVEGEIRVCGRKALHDTYRPEAVRASDRFDPKPIIERGARDRYRLTDAARSGTGSCSATGGGGWTGGKPWAERHGDQ